MKIIKVQNRTPILIEQLVQVWQDSVKETHLFLSEKEITNIKKYIPQALADIANLIIVEKEKGVPIAFMGIEQEKLEMLFIAPQERGRGLGKKLLKYSIKEYSINELGVNEQNPEAKGFYERMGFQVYKRTATDEQGLPYPILYMKLLADSDMNE